MTLLSTCSPCSIDANIGGKPSARMMTPTICTMVSSAVDPVVGVVGRREPAEVDPRPADRERREREAEQPGADVVLGEHVRELGRGDAERDDEGQVEQQFQRRRDPMLLVRIAARHRPDAMDWRHVLRLRIDLSHSMILSDRQPATFHGTTGPKRLVIGASGFLGSHASGQLVDPPVTNVRVLIRRAAQPYRDNRRSSR